MVIWFLLSRASAFSVRVSPVLFLLPSYWCLGGGVLECARMRSTLTSAYLLLKLGLFVRARDLPQSSDKSRY